MGLHSKGMYGYNGSGNNCTGKGMVMRIVVGEMVVARV